MLHLETRRAMPVSADELYAWHMEPGAFDKLLPPWQKVRILKRPASLTEGALLVMKLYVGPVGVRWEALHRDFIEGRQFVDEQVRGPFAHWVHTHRFEPQSEDSSLLVDSVAFKPPLGRPGALVGELVGRKMLEKLFAFRHDTTFAELSRRRVDRALANLLAQEYWDAHEHLEAVWRCLAPSAAREAIQSLIQFAAACHKITQATKEHRDPLSMQRGMAKLIESGRAHLEAADAGAAPAADFSTAALARAFGRLADIQRQWAGGLGDEQICGDVAACAADLASELAR